MKVRTNYVIIWWLLQAIILIGSYSASVDFLITGLLLLLVTLISVLMHSLIIKAISYLLLVGYSLVSFIFVWLSWLFFVNDLFDLGTLFFLIPLVNLYVSVKNFFKFYIKSLGTWFVLTKKWMLIMDRFADVLFLMSAFCCCSTWCKGLTCEPSLEGWNQTESRIWVVSVYFADLQSVWRLKAEAWI